MRTPRVCCCTPPTGGPTRWWVECFGKRNEIWDECGEPYHYMPLFDETTTAGQAAYQSYFGGIPAVNSVWKLSGQDAFETGTILSQCGEIKTTAPTGRRRISLFDFTQSSGVFSSRTGCNDHRCLTHYRLKPCGYPFSQEVTNPPEIYWATDDYWDSVLSGGLPFTDSPKPGGCPTVDLDFATYLVNIPGRDPYCAVLDTTFPGPSAQEVAQAQPPGGSTTYTRVDNASATGECGCQSPACLDLFIFDPCPGSPSGSYSMAATAEDWQTILGLSATPDASISSTYAGYWRFKRLNPGGSEYGCCNSPGGQTSDPTPEFCGSLRPRNANDLDGNFCYGPGAPCDASPNQVCQLTSSIANRIQIIGDTIPGAAVNPDAWFTAIDFPPQTGDACDRHDCTKCFSVNCGDGKVFVDGVFKLTYSAVKSFQGVRTSTPTQTVSGICSLSLSYSVPYTAEMTYQEGASLCDVTPGPGCYGPIDTSAPIVIGKWVPSGSGITLGNISLGGEMDLETTSVFPTATETYQKAWAYALPSSPNETVEDAVDGQVNVAPSVSIELQKRWGLRADISGDDDLTSVVCNANLSNCYTVCRGTLNWTPKILWGGTYFESDSTPSTTSDTGVGSLIPAGFEMIRVVPNADDVTCCESTPQYFNGPIIWANCADTFVNLNTISSKYDTIIQAPVGSHTSSAYYNRTDTAHCPGNIFDDGKLIWSECGNWNVPQSTATGGPWCGGYSANLNKWAVSFASGGKISPNTFYNSTNNQTFSVECEMEHEILAMRCG